MNKYDVDCIPSYGTEYLNSLFVKRLVATMRIARKIDEEELIICYLKKTSGNGLGSSQFHAS